MFEIGDFVKDKVYGKSRDIYCARVMNMDMNESGLEEVQLKVYNSNAGYLGEIWVDQYRLKKMTNEEKGIQMGLIVSLYEKWMFE